MYVSGFFVTSEEGLFHTLKFRILKVTEMLYKYSGTRLFILIERTKESFPFIFRMQSRVTL